MFVWQAKKTLTAANAAIIAASQSPGAGPITLLSVPVVLDTPRRVLLTSGGNDSGITFTITGTTFSGLPLSESVTGGNASAVESTQDFATVASVASSGAVAGTLSVGTSTTGSTPWFQVNTWAQQVEVGIGGVVSGTVSWEVEYTYDDIQKPFTGQFPTTFVPAAFIPDPATTNQNISLTTPVNAIRFTVTGGTGTLFGQIIQSDSVGGG